MRWRQIDRRGTERHACKAEEEKKPMENGDHTENEHGNTTKVCYPLQSVSCRVVLHYRHML
jgi:hypothetical protein